MLMSQIPNLHWLFVWQKDAIFIGQWWRIVTGNITHTNWNHLALNLAGLTVWCGFYRDLYHQCRTPVLTISIMIAIGVISQFTSLVSFSGFSGVLYGLFMWSGVRDIMQKRVFSGGLVVVAIVTKLAYDLITQGNEPLMQNFINANIAYQAHIIGAMFGGLWALLESSLTQKGK